MTTMKRTRTFQFLMKLRPEFEHLRANDHLGMLPSRTTIWVLNRLVVRNVWRMQCMKN
uniref:Uncharacterized protein n=1 Tax=Solanum lycopersicum TaxID=4081 RepID=A0A3Q7G6C6_SOLLC